MRAIFARVGLASKGVKSTLVPRVAGCFVLVFALEQAACTSQSTVAIGSPREALVAHHGVIELVDAAGDAVLVAPESDISFTTRDGATTPTVPAGLLCRTDRGLALRPSASAPCAFAAPFIDWDAIGGAEISTFDGAGTTAIAAGIVIVVAVAAIALAGGSGKGPSSSPSKKRTAAKPTTGSPPSGRPGAPGPVVGGPPEVGPSHVGPPLHVGPPYGGGVVIVPIPVGGRGYGYSSGGPGYVEGDDGALFTRADERRATLRGVLGFDGGVCVFSLGAKDSGPCFASGLRGGVRLFNLVELTLGLRAISGWGVHDYPRAAPVLGLGLHGELPHFRRFSLEVGAQLGHTSAMDVYANLLLGFRFAPVTHFWLGVFPIHPAYVSWSDGRGDQWTLQSSLNLSVDF